MVCPAFKYLWAVIDSSTLAKRHFGWLVPYQKRDFLMSYELYLCYIILER